MAGTNEYNLRVRTGEEFLSDLYVKRQGANVEVRTNTLLTIQPILLVVFTLVIRKSGSSMIMAKGRSPVCVIAF